MRYNNKKFINNKKNCLKINRQQFSKEHLIFHYPYMYEVFLLVDSSIHEKSILHIIENVFHMDSKTAKKNVKIINKTGRILCGIYTKDVAETKIKKVLRHMLEIGQNIDCVMQRGRDNVIKKS